MNDIKNVILDRTKNSYFGTFFLSLILMNHEIVLIVLSTIDPSKKINLINYYEVSYCKIFVAFISPFIYSFLSVFLGSLVNILSMFSQKIFLNIRSKLQKDLEIIEKNGSKYYQKLSEIDNDIKYINDRLSNYSLNKNINEMNEEEKNKFISLFGEKINSILLKQKMDN